MAISDDVRNQIRELESAIRSKQLRQIERYAVDALKEIAEALDKLEKRTPKAA